MSTTTDPPPAIPAAEPVHVLDPAPLDAVVERARAAADAFRKLDQEQVDKIVRAMVVAGLEHAVDLAQLAMEETGFGVFEDKVVKNFIATEFLYDYLEDKRTVGVISEDAERAIQEVAEPIGVVLALLPITNPTSTALFKSIVGAKTRNAMIFRPSARAARCAQRAIEILQEAGEAASLPQHALQVVPDPTLDVSQYLFHHDGVDLIWTTGGPKAVQATNEAGKPCIGVGSGNAPVYLHRSADVRMAVVDILISKTFDASLICPAEQTIVVDEPIYDEVIAELVPMGARVLNHDERDALAKLAFEPDGRVQIQALGQSCTNLAALGGFSAAGDDAAKVLLAPLPSDLGELAAHPLVREKLMPVLGIVRSPSVEHGIAACEIVTEQGGLGHTSAVYANDDDVIARFADAIRTGRILVNAPTAVGALGGVYNALTPTFSLGCGTWGGSNTTANVNYRELLNIKTVSRRQAPPQWFRVPSTTFFNPGSIESLRELPTAQVLIVTDAGTEARGAVDEVRRHLSTAAVHVFPELQPEPTEEQIVAGARALAETRADLVVAVGGGSVIDAAKAMRLFGEHPELSLRELSLPFLDARKRVSRFPAGEHRSRLVAVPTTSGTGSEVSPAAVITSGGAKVTLVDYSLVPDMAVVEPRLTLSMPPTLTADTGIDALTHALEAYVSIFASPYTGAFCLQAIHLILDALPRAFANGDDLAARTDMANAATIAGLAFSNAFVGVNHGLAHALRRRARRPRDGRVPRPEPAHEPPHAARRRAARAAGRRGMSSARATGRTAVALGFALAVVACALAPAASARTLTLGSNGPDVRNLKSSLADLGYLPAGAVSRDFDQRTWHAVVAMQGWMGLPRDGVAGPRTRRALKVAVRPVPSSRKTGFEIHVRSQVLLIVRNGRTVRAIHVSTGAGDRTPYGHFAVYSRQRMSWSRPFQTWMPFAQYFNGGYAMHEYPSVPAYAASHGCVRLPAQESRVVWRYGRVGDRVWVMARHAPSR